MFKKNIESFKEKLNNSENSFAELEEKIQEMTVSV